MLELSSFQLETIRTFRAHVGVCLNVTQNHLDRHHTFENYAAAKGNLFRTQQPGDYAVLNADDRRALPVVRQARLTGQPVTGAVWFSDGRIRTMAESDAAREIPDSRRAQRGERDGRGGGGGIAGVPRRRSSPP